MDRLLREGNPPTGQLASPKPQYKKPGVDEYEPVEGQHGAPFAILKDASGNVVSPATDAKLEQVKSELELVKSELEAIKANQLSGDQKVQLSGHVVEQIPDFTDATIPAGTTKTTSFTPPEWARGFSLAIRSVRGTPESVRYAEGFNRYYSQAIAKPLESMYSGIMYLTRRVPFRGNTVALWITAPAHEDVVIQFAQIHWWGDNDAEAVRGYDPETGLAKQFATVRDPNTGLYYMGVVPMGHVAYDDFEDRYRVDARPESRMYHRNVFDYFLTGGGGRVVGDGVNQYTTDRIAPWDISRLTEKMIVVNNTHNQALRANFYVYDSLEPLTSSEAVSNAILALGTDIPIPANTTKVFTVEELPGLNNPWVGLLMRVFRTIVPTEGAVDISFWGR